MVLQSPCILLCIFLPLQFHLNFDPLQFHLKVNQCVSMINWRIAFGNGLAQQQKHSIRIYKDRATAVSLAIQGKITTTQKQNFYFIRITKWDIEAKSTWRAEYLCLHAIQNQMSMFIEWHIHCCSVRFVASSTVNVSIVEIFHVWFTELLSSLLICDRFANEIIIKHQANK